MTTEHDIENELLLDELDDIELVELVKQRVDEPIIEVLIDDL